MKKIIFLVLIAIIVVFSVSFFNLPERIGLVKSPAEKLLEPALNERMATSMMEQLESTGINTRGMDIYVIPYKESDANLVVAVFDASQGFDIRNFSREDAITEYLELLAGLDEDGKYNIKRVAVDYKNEEGESLLTLTAPSDTITRYSEGSISRQQFLQELEGQVNFVEVAKLLTGEL